MHEQIAETESQTFVLAAGQWNARAPTQLGHLAHVVLRQRLLEERDSIGFDTLREFGRMEQVEAAIGVDIEIDVRAHGFAHSGNTAHILSDDLVDRSRFVAPRQRMVADRHLQPSKTPRYKQLRRLGELITLEETETERRVNRHARASAAQQAPQRQTKRFGIEVPQRNIKCCNRVAGIARLAARRQQPIKFVPQPLGGQRVLADQGRPRDFAHGGGDDFFFGDGGHAVTNKTRVGLDLGQAQRKRGFLM